MRGAFLCWRCRKTMLKIPGRDVVGFMQTRKFALACSFAHLRSLAILFIPPPASHKHGLMHRDIPRTHGPACTCRHTTFVVFPCMGGKVGFESIALLRIYWPLVVNNDMTHPVERLLFTWAWWGQTGMHEVQQPGSQCQPPLHTNTHTPTTSFFFSTSGLNTL